jgi:hypothetical protein
MNLISSIGIVEIATAETLNGLKIKYFLPIAESAHLNVIGKLNLHWR